MTNIEITPREVKDLLALEPKVLFVDVREQWEYDTARIAGSVLIPLGDLTASLAEVPADRASLHVDADEERVVERREHRGRQ